MSQSSTRVLDYRSGTRVWTPPQIIVDHSNKSLRADADFFQAPPADIGPVQSAYTSLRVDKEPMSMPLRAIIRLLSALPGAAIMAFGFQNNAPGGMIFGVILLAIGIAISAVKTGFNHSCTFVGVGGASRFKISGSRDCPPRSDGIRFDQAAELRTAQTRQFVNGVYSGTNYSFKWTDARGQKVYTLAGRFRSKQGTPKVGDPFYFARAAEIAWSVYLLDQAQAQLRATGYLHFNVGPGQWVRVGPGFFEFCLNGEVARIATNEIKTVNLQQGRFHIAHRDAGWFSRKGKFSFNYAAMANARLFLLAMDKLLGIRFG